MSDRSERQSARIKAILRDLQQGGAVSIEDLCERYEASLATIRRDLQELEDRGLLRRVRGGAMPLEPLFYEPFRTNPSFQDVVGRQTDQKRRIGQAAAELLQPGNTISLTAGTTTTEVVRCLPYEFNLKVITNTVNVAMELSKRKDVDVFVTGGHLRGDWFSLVGPAAIDTLRHAFVDVAFIGADGIDIAAGLTCRSPEEAAVNRVMVAQAKRRIAVIDCSKFGIVAEWQICSVETCDLIITDSALPDAALALFAERNVELRRV
jgi:DeoR family transcriptional regulator of aga operon